MINFVSTGLSLSSPYLISVIIDFIESKDHSSENMEIGLAYVAALVLSQTMSYLIAEHLEYYQKMIGVKQSNALVALIYRKQLKLSAATNKKFSQGEVVNFVQVDA